MKKIVISLVCLLFVVCGVSVSAVLLSSYGSSITNPADGAGDAICRIDVQIVKAKSSFVAGTSNSISNIDSKFYGFLGQVSIEDDDGSVQTPDEDYTGNTWTCNTIINRGTSTLITVNKASPLGECLGFYYLNSYNQLVCLYDDDWDYWTPNLYGSQFYYVVFREKAYYSMSITYHNQDLQSTYADLKVEAGSTAQFYDISAGSVTATTSILSEGDTVGVKIVSGGSGVITFSIAPGYEGEYFIKSGSPPTDYEDSKAFEISSKTNTRFVYHASGDIHIYVRELYPLTFGSGEGTGENKTVYKLHGINETLPSLSGYSRTGYTATKWKSGSTEYSPGATYTANASATFIPNWTPIQYSVTTYFDYPDGFGNYIDVSYDQTLALNVLPDETNRKFKGWLFEGMDSSVHQIGDVQTSATSYFWSADNGVDVSGGLTGKGVYYKNLTSVAGSEIIVIAQWEVATYNFNINFLMPDESEPVSTGEAGKATITYSDTGETVVAWNERENDKLNAGQTITISNIIPGAGLAVESVSCTGFTQSSSGNTYTFTMGAQAGTITIKMRWDNSANLRLNWKALNMSETETLNNVGGSVELTRKLGQGSGISNVASTYTSTITAERSISDKTFTIKAIPSENYIFMGFTTTDAKPTEASQTFTYTGTDDVLYSSLYSSEANAVFTAVI